MPDKPLSRYAKVLGFTALAGGVGGIASGLVAAIAPERGWIGPALTAMVVSLAMAAGLWASLRWWKALDEAAQEAHKWAWWWGATVGLCVAGVILLTLLYGPNDLGQTDIEDGLQWGAGIVVGCQIAGYGVAWAVWWLKRR